MTNPNRFQFFALKGREEQEKSIYVDNGSFLVFSFPVYALLDQGSTLSVVTSFVANQFDLIPEILHEPLFVSTPLGESVKAEEVCYEIDSIVASTF